MKKNNLYISGIYFIQSSTAIKIGKASLIAERFEAIQTSNPDFLKIHSIIPCSVKMYTREERLAHNFFKQWHLRGEWYKLDIIPMIKDYIKKRNGLLIEHETKINKSGIYKIATLEGVETVKLEKPMCHFYSWLPAQSKGVNGPKQTYRKMLFKGNWVYISHKKHEENRDFVKNLKSKYKINNEKPSDLLNLLKA